MAAKQQEFVINAQGIAADVSWIDDSWMHDSRQYEFTVFLKFRNPVLNPPNAFDDQGWEAGRFSMDYVTSKTEAPSKAMETAQRFYDFLMTLRTPLGQEVIADYWRIKYETLRDEVAELELKIKDGQIFKKALEARIAELETGYVKKLEDEIRLYKGMIKAARERAYENAKLLKIKD